MCYDGSGSSRKQGPDNAYQSQSQVSHMKEAFDILDRDGDGNIKAEDLSAFLEDSLKRPLSSEDVRRMIDLADADGNGGVDFEEFLSLVLSQAPEKPDCFANLGRDALGDMFRVLDRNGDGLLCLGDLDGVMGSLGQSLSSDELMAMVETATGSGQKEVRRSKIEQKFTDRRKFEWKLRGRDYHDLNNHCQTWFFRFWM